MLFKDTKRFSPVIYEKDLPDSQDYFHKPPESIDKEFLKKGNYYIDSSWWSKQYDRCINGYSVKDSIVKGGDMLIDGLDAIWYPDGSCYIPLYDLLIKDRTVHISGRMYFYLNFWPIYGKSKGKLSKGLINPKFIALDFFFAQRTEMMINQKKDGQELKGRQEGFSEKGAGMIIGYNYTFHPDSQNLIIGGIQADADHTMQRTDEGLINLANTQFYKERARGGDSKKYIKAKYYGSEIHSLTAKDDPQTASRFCLGKGTGVIMYDGSVKNVEDIKISDQLMGLDSTPRNVLATTSGEDTMYKISSSKSESFICNSEHLLYCYHNPVERKRNIKRDGKYVTNNFNDRDVIKIDDNHFLIKAKDLVGKSKTFKRHTLVEKSRGVEFPYKKTVIDPYFLGLWLGDGDSEGLRFTTMDKDIVDYLYKYAKDHNYQISSSAQRDPVSKKDSRASRYRIFEKPKNKKGGIRQTSNLINQFREYNLINCKRIPDNYKYNSREVRLQLLAGLIDTDGWKNKNGYGFAQVDKDIAYDVKYICESLGFNVNISLKKNGIINGYHSRDIYDLYIYGENIGDIPLKIKRKKQPNYQYRSLHPYKSRIKIEEIGKDEYYGFELDGDKLFLLSDFTITHNSPFWAWYEEIGKGKKEWSLEVAKYIDPSIETEGEKTGWQTFIGCVCAGTKVWTKKGEMINIEDLKKSDGILGYNGEGIEKENITHINPPQEKPCYRIKTRFGRTLECSEDHPILYSTYKLKYNKRKYVKGKREYIQCLKKVDWKEAKDIIIGDQLSVIGEIPVFGKENMWNPRLVGWLIGDGSYGFDNTPKLSNCDDEINNHVMRHFDYSIDKCRFTKDFKIYQETRIKGITKDLRRLGIYGQTKDKKRLPNDLHLYNKESICELIGGLFDTDGCVSIINIDGKKSVYISITQLSYSLLIELQYLLLKIGVNSNISVIKNKDRNRKIRDKNEYYILGIGNAVGLFKFYKNIKLTIQYKQNILDLIPTLCSIPDKNDVVFTEFATNRSGTVKVNNVIYFDSVVSIEYIGSKPVYNLSVSNTHTYIANGIITHNTAGEMDEGIYDLELRHCNPEEYNILEFDNVFEVEDADRSVKVGHFTGKDWYFLVDEDGNALRGKSRKELLRRRAVTKPEKRYKLITQRPIYASEAFLTTMAGFFGEYKIQLLNARKTLLRTRKELQIVRRGRLEFNEGTNWRKGVTFVPDEANGWLKIVEEPELDNTGKLYRNLYKGGIDSYDQDEAHTSKSKGAMYVKKGLNPYSKGSVSNLYVAQVLERPSVEEGGAEAFYLHCAMVGIWYGLYGDINIEYSNLRIFQYFTDHGFEFLLKERPRLAFAGMIGKTQVSNRYGTDKSLKPQILAIGSNSLTQESIDNMYFIEMVIALAQFRYDPSGKKYNCDITIAFCETEVGMKEDEMIPVIKEGGTKETKKKGFLVYTRNSNGISSKFV